MTALIMIMMIMITLMTMMIMMVMFMMTTIIMMTMMMMFMMTQGENTKPPSRLFGGSGGEPGEDLGMSGKDF